MLQKPEDFRVKAKGEAVAIYCEPLATKEMGYPRLSHRVNKIEMLDTPFHFVYAHLG